MSEADTFRPVSTRTDHTVGYDVENNSYYIILRDTSPWEMHREDQCGVIITMSKDAFRLLRTPESTAHREINLDEIIKMMVQDKWVL